MSLLKKNEAWVLFPKPNSVNIVACIWLYKKKGGIVGIEFPSFKSRVVAKGLHIRKGYTSHKFSHMWSSILP